MTGPKMEKYCVRSNPYYMRCMVTSTTKLCKFLPNECPCLCRHRPGHSLGKKKYFLTHCALGDANGEVLNADEEDGETEAL